MTNRDISNEHIIWESKPSLLLYWPRYIFYSLLCFSWLLLPKDILFFEFYAGVYFYHLALIFSILIIFPLLVAILNLLCTKYELTQERFIFYSGILSRKREVIELYRVKDFNVISPLHLRIFGFSNIFLHTSDKTAPTFKIAAIQEGYKTEDTIRFRVEEMRRLKGVREFD